MFLHRKVSVFFLPIVIKTKIQLKRMQKYYIDTCVWRDYYENRFSKSGKPFGKYAACLFMKIIKSNAFGVHHVIRTVISTVSAMQSYNVIQLKPVKPNGQ